ncbi:MAG TPA: type I phosphomannose isomerase catalytic subunit [Candidatus Acidoferrales bacterium]|nr:type I phosphomannose isomerase catalytic subunit [Candidatus Acidoferrales bacterium]
MNPEPFRIEPFLSPRLWGARSLAPLFPQKTDLAEPVGEAWLTGLDCRVSTGQFAGRTLREAWHQMPHEWRGAHAHAAPDFPLLVKFIFPMDKLSIQVHPDDAYAAAHEKAAGGRGKTEMWHAVSAEPGAQVLLGLKPGVNKETFLEALSAHTLESLFERHPVHAGATFFIPAGTPHTIGPGMVLCEVQQYSDLTYRIYDYGRTDANGHPRELHIAKALDVLRFGYTGAGQIAPLSLSNANGHAKLLCACRHFAAERIDFSDRCEFPADAGAFQLLVILAGRGNLGWPSSAARYSAGECWFLPASLGLAALHPLQPTSILRAYVPDLAALRLQLHAAGISANAISHSVFS